MFWSNTYAFMASRAIAGICSGFNTTNAPRLILENYPTKQRGLPTSIYSLFLCFGLFYSFSTGKIFGDSLGKYWLILMVFPSGLQLLRAILVFFTCRHETPIHYQVKSDETENEFKKRNYTKKRDDLLYKFYRNSSEISQEQNRLKHVTTQLQHKQTEKTLKDLIYINLINRKQRFAA